MSTDKTAELYTTLAGEGVDEFEEKRSLFIGHAKHVTSEEEAQEFVKQKKKEYKNQSESWNEIYRQTNKECAIMAKDLMQRMYDNKYK